jgi:hypothetical protein
MVSVRGLNLTAVMHATVQEINCCLGVVTSAKANLLYKSALIKELYMYRVYQEEFQQFRHLLLRTGT